MRRRPPVEQHFSVGPTKPSVLLHRRRRRRCLLLAGIACFVLCSIVCSLVFLGRHFQQRGGATGGVVRRGREGLPPYGHHEGQVGVPSLPPATDQKETSTQTTARPTLVSWTDTVPAQQTTSTATIPAAPAQNSGEALPNTVVPTATLQRQHDLSHGAASGAGTALPATKVKLRLYPQLLFVPNNDTFGDDDGLTLVALRGGDRTSDMYKRHAVLPDGAAQSLGLAFDEHDTVAPLHKLQVELHRQRVDRHTWWWRRHRRNQEEGDGAGGRAATHYDAPIVSLSGPSLPVTHFFPHELLVEEVLPGDDGLNRYPDPSRHMPVYTKASRLPAPPDAAVAEDSEVRVFAFDEGEGHAMPAPPPVLRFRKKLTDAVEGDVAPDEAAGAAGQTKSPYVTAQWILSRPAPVPGTSHAATGEETMTTVDVDLYTVRPSKDTSSDGSRTTSLAGTFTFRDLKRLYGLPGAGAAAADSREGQPPAASTRGDAAAARTSLFGRFCIPRDGFRDVASVWGRDEFDHTKAPGVMPLVFADIGASPPSPSARPRDREEDAERAGGAVGKTKEEEEDNVRTVGVLWMTSAPFSVRTKSLSAATRTTRLSFSSSAAETRVYLLPGPTHADVLRQYYTLTGFPAMPPVFALGYHHHFAGPFITDGVPFPPSLSHVVSAQGAGNVSRAASSGPSSSVVVTLQSALQAANSLFLDAGVPVDSIGYTGSEANQRLTPFSWKARLLPDPMRLQTNLWLHGRRFFFVRATPHIPVVQSSPLYQEGRKHGFFVSTEPDDDTWYIAFPMEVRLQLRKRGGGLGPGEQRGGWDVSRSHVVDFFHPMARRWFGSMLKLKRFSGSTNKTFVALAAAGPDADMEAHLTLPMGVGHYGGTSHRQVHNAYGVYYLLSAVNGLLRRTKYFRRAFAPTEHYFVGAQRLGAAVFVVPTLSQGERDHVGKRARALEKLGDEQTQVQQQQLPAELGQGGGGGWRQPHWRRLRATISDVLALSMSGLPFTGANAAGFQVDFLRQYPTAGKGSLALHELGLFDLSDAEKTELMARWYQSASVFPWMRVEEGRGLLPGTSLATAAADDEKRRQADRRGEGGSLGHSPSSSPPLPPREGQLGGAATATTTSSSPTMKAVASALSSFVLPSLLLPSNAAAREAVQLRYALLPYLYTSLWRTSEQGAQFLFSPTFLSARNREDDGDGKPGAARPPPPDVNTCFSVGAVLVACPITMSATTLSGGPGLAPATTVVRLPSLPPSPPDAPEYAARYYYYNLYTGARVRAGARVTVPLARSASSQAARGEGPLVWLGEAAQPTRERARDSDGIVVSRLPLFQREGSILPTFTVYSPSFPAASSSSASTVWSTHVPSNVSLTIALPPNLQELYTRFTQQQQQGDEDPAKRLVLATGEMFWDEGSENYQVSTPPSKLPADPEEAEEAELMRQEDAEEEMALQKGVARNNNDNGNAEEADAAAIEAERALRQRQRRREDRRLSQRHRRAQQRLRRSARYCHVTFSCYLSGGKLSLTATPAGTDSESRVSPIEASEQHQQHQQHQRTRCVEALELLEMSWNEVPAQTLADFQNQQERAALRQQEEQRRMDAAADRGERRVSNGEEAKRAEDGPMPADAVVPHTLATALQLRFVRFLAASAADAKWLAAMLEQAPVLSLVKEGMPEGDGEGIVGGYDGAVSVTARVLPAIQALGYRQPRPATPVIDGVAGEQQHGTVTRGEVKPWRLSFSPPPLPSRSER